MAKLSKTLPIAMGTLAVCALALTSASAASLADGKFLIHAQNDAEPEINAIAGSQGTTSGNPGGPGTETPSDFTPVSYSCGPMTFTVTTDMYEFSKKNQELRAAGRESEIVNDPSGWNTIYTFNGALTEGFPADGSKPPVVLLNTAPDLNLDAMPAYYINMGDCSIKDVRDPQPGKRAIYELNSTGVVDARFESVSGKTVLSKIALNNDGSSTFERSSGLVIDENNRHVSTSYPYSIFTTADGFKVARLRLPAIVNNYNEVAVGLGPEGNGYAFYYHIMGPVQSENAQRTDGPIQVEWNSSGEFTRFYYLNSEGVEAEIPDRGTPYTVAEYNAITGQNWDGSHYEMSDLNTELPFTATPR